MNQASENEKIKDFTDLNAWKKAHELALAIYQLTEKFPQQEQYALSNQMRRAAISITSNLAEGFSRNSPNEKIHFYAITRGSNTELQNQLILSKDLGYTENGEFQKIFEQTVVVSKLVNGLTKGARNLERYS